MSKGLKITLISIASALVLLVLVCGGVGLLLYKSFQGPQNIAIVVNSPNRVKSGESFTIEIAIENQADKAQTLDSIDIYDTYLEGVKLQRSTPLWRSSDSIFNFVSYDYQVEIPANGRVVVKFDAIALKPGDYTGDFDLCINSEVSFITEVVRTIVDQ